MSLPLTPNGALRIGTNPNCARPRPDSACARARRLFASGWKGTAYDLAAALNIPRKRAQDVLGVLAQRERTITPVSRSRHGITWEDLTAL